MKIAISGIHGLVGSTLKNYFLKKGYKVTAISRRIDPQVLEGQDVIIHLAGANISAKSWTAAYKKEIIDSRVKSTELLVDAIKEMNRRPKIFLSASAVGYYGDRDPQIAVNERSPRGQGFLSEVCQEWEEASAELVTRGVRLVHMRFGVILSKKGGALAKMLLPFYFCLGGRLGSGRQKMSWVMLEEIPSIVEFIISHDTMSGPVNVVSPSPVTNAEFTNILGDVIHRPTIFPIPGFMVKILFGQMGKELLLEGAHVVPQMLIDNQYQFQYPDLRQALQQVL